MSQAITGDTRVTTSGAARRAWLGSLAVTCAALGLVLCSGALIAVVVPRLWAGHGLPSALRSPDWLPYAWLCGIAGIAPALVGLALGLAGLLGLVRTNAGRLGRRCVAAAVLGLLALAAAGGVHLLLRQSPYSLYGLRRPASAADLEALGPASVVRTYLTSGDLSVQYWLEDAEGRHFWHSGNASPDLSLAAPATEVRIAPLNDSGCRNDAAHRCFEVSYVTHAPDSVGNPAGPRTGIARLVRAPGGPWRVSFLGQDW